MLNSYAENITGHWIKEKFQGRWERGIHWEEFEDLMHQDNFVKKSYREFSRHKAKPESKMILGGCIQIEKVNATVTWREGDSGTK